LYRHVFGSLILAEVMREAGIRAFVGKLSMDISSRPSYVEHSAESSVESVTEFVKRCAALMSDLPPERRLVEPVITPRFVPTCSNELLAKLGELSKTRCLRVQSHMAEAHDQVQWVERERGTSDVEVFASVSLPHLLLPMTYKGLSCTEWFANASNYTSPLYIPRRRSII